MVGEILSDEQILELIRAGAIKNADPRLINPGSLDLRLSSEIHKMLGSILPQSDEAVEDILRNKRLVDKSFTAATDFFLAKHQPYIIRLVEELDLPESVSARVFNKSGRGRIGTSVKTLCDCVPGFDTIPLGYKGPLYSEVTATAFGELIKCGHTTMPQIRFYEGNPEPITGHALELLLREHPLIHQDNGKPVLETREQMQKVARTGKLTFTADLSGPLLFYKGNNVERTIDLEIRNQYDPSDFFEECRATQKDKHTALIKPNEFILIHSRENLRLPPNYAIEIAEYTASIGDLKSHYAGLVNPGHGNTPKFTQDHIVFEVRARDVPIIIRHGQPLAEFEVYRMAKEPKNSYIGGRSTSFNSLPSILPTQFKRA